MNTNIINALRKYVDDYTNVYSFNGLVVKAAQKYLGETVFTSFNDLVRRSANKYTGGSRLSVNDAVRDALVQYTGSSSFSVGDLINIAAVKYLTEPPAPANTTAPVVTGTPSVGSVLTCSTGTWSNSPTGYAYQWRADGIAIVSATSNTYTVQAGDVSKTLTCAVTATNAGGSTSAVSNGVVVSAAKTYAEFQAHIATLATSGAKTWASASSAPGAYRTTVGVGSGTLFGTPWLSTFHKNAGSNAAFDRVVQHAFPSLAVFNAQQTREVFVRMVNEPDGPLVGTNRNGYESFSDPGVFTRMSCPEIIYWDGTQAQRMQPSLGLGPTPYTW